MGTSFWLIEILKLGGKYWFNNLFFIIGINCEKYCLSDYEHKKKITYNIHIDLNEKEKETVNKTYYNITI